MLGQFQLHIIARQTNDHESSRLTTNPQQNGQSLQAGARTGPYRRRNRSWHVPGMDTSSTNVHQFPACCVCGISTCDKISHRLAQIEMLRRISRSNRARMVDGSDAAGSYKRPALVTPTRINRTPMASGQVDPFVLLPLKGITKTAIGQFHQYFTCQASSVFDPDRPLGFDESLLHLRFRQAMASGAMCASVITMAATMNALRYRKLTTPDADLMVSYNVSLRALRNEIKELDGEKFSENTILAAISIATSCAIAFPDVQVALSHWQGVLALYNRQNPMWWSGPVIAWVDNFEWWMTILADLQPRIRLWPTPVCRENATTIEMYGKAFRPLFDCALKKNDLAFKLLTLCLNMCRAIEMLERLAKRPQKTPDTYFDYFRLVLMNQSTIVSGLINDSDALAKSINITITICFMMLLRVLPYHFPLQHLCTRLRASIKGGCLFSFGNSPIVVPSPSPGSQEAADVHSDQTDGLVRDAHIWMLCICICAARQSGEHSCQAWAVSALRKISGFDVHTQMWQIDLIRRARLFCWSDDFLSKHLLKINL